MRNDKTTIDKTTICVIGLGYVGLPLAVEFAKAGFEVSGYDINSKRVNELMGQNIDSNGEVSQEDLNKNYIYYTDFEEDIPIGNDFYIVTVPTPVDEDMTPNYQPLKSASFTVGKLIRDGSTVIYESTVNPGVTRNLCVPILEFISGLKMNDDFGVGYSPERMNPGDKLHNVSNIVKVTSGSSAGTAHHVDSLYRKIVKAGTHLAESIEIAEASKIVENTQRDFNIAFMNEMAMLFSDMDIDIYDVLNAANTKWNFLDFKPGLVGGHCISVDPYYLLTHSKTIGDGTSLSAIAEARNTNEYRYVEYIVRNISTVTWEKTKNRKELTKILILGFAFKENCSDFRNTKIANVANKLMAKGHQVDIFDPLVDIDEALRRYSSLNFIDEINEDDTHQYDAIVLAVPHTALTLDAQFEITRLCKDSDKPLIFDLKGAMPRSEHIYRI